MLKLSGGAGVALLAGTACQPSTTPRQVVVGPGSWCWFQAPRAVVSGSTLLIGSTLGGTGTASDGDVNVDQVDLDTFTVGPRRLVGHDLVDDHTSPSVFAFQDGIQVAWAAHNHRDWLEVGYLGAPLQRILRPDSTVAPGRGVSYASAHVVIGQRWIMYRGEQFSWNLITSDDGTTWDYRGLIIAPAPGGQRPYIQATNDGLRLHLTVSDGNPSEYRGTNVGYCTVNPDFSITDNAGKLIGTVGSNPAPLSSLTRLFTGTAGATESADVDGWICDLTYTDRHPTAILSVRDNWPATGPRIGNWRHAYRWARQRKGGAWTVEHLAWAGSELYTQQPDYTGLAALDPTDARSVVISTNVHPATGALLRSKADGKVRRELWGGYRYDEGKWLWKALTQDSTADNIRPMIVGSGSYKVLVWLRGTYRSYTNYTTQIVVRSHAA